ncbi:hypothetical protein LCGC14_2710210 [marine sediment metagenome]|uniref:Uncharacterized protein n=1 Tax=marine sediment metagenome TaxID=412755 RepID=A0A0F9A0W1_9ZZZZ
MVDPSTLRTTEVDFVEDEHPREEHGKFTSKGGGAAKKTKKTPSKSKVKGTQSKNFKKAMDKIAPEVERRFDDDTEYDRNRRALVQNLDGYPQHSSQLRGVGVKIKSPILKSHLSDVYPDAKWSVRTEYYSGGSSMTAGWKGGGGYPYGADEIIHVYSDRGATDSMVDYFDTDNYASLYDMGLASLDKAWQRAKHAILHHNVPSMKASNQ